jgi:hypothetical protein
MPGSVCRTVRPSVSSTFISRHRWRPTSPDRNSTGSPGKALPAGPRATTSRRSSGQGNDDPHARILIAGDFNAEEREVPTRIITAELEDTANGDLAARVLVPLEHSLPESRRYSVIHRGRRIMLDHMFASRTLLAAYQGMEIHNEALGDELIAYASVHGSPESYHAPVVATFQMPS